MVELRQGAGSLGNKLVSSLISNPNLELHNVDPRNIYFLAKYYLVSDSYLEGETKEYYILSICFKYTIKICFEIYSQFLKAIIVKCL